MTDGLPDLQVSEERQKLPYETTIKHWVYEAINLLEASYVYAQSPRKNSAWPETGIYLYLESYKFQFYEIYEIHRLCHSQEAISAQILAKVTTRLAVTKTIPTIVVTTLVSPVVCAVSLILWQAEMELGKAINIDFETNSAILKIMTSAGRLSASPLWIVAPTNSRDLWNIAYSAVKKHDVRHIVLDKIPSEGVNFLKKMRNELKVPITITTAS